MHLPVCCLGLGSSTICMNRPCRGKRLCWSFRRESRIAVEVFRKVEANPLKSTAMEGAEFARSHKCDFVVALGGGSVMDAAKIMAMMAKNQGDLWDYVTGGTGKGLPLAKAP